MAIFKVGQRVRIIANKWDPEIIGHEATIYRAGMYGPPHWVLDVDGLGRFNRAQKWAYQGFPHELVPLIGPTEDAEFRVFINKLIEPRPITIPVEIL